MNAAAEVQKDSFLRCTLLLLMTLAALSSSGQVVARNLVILNANSYLNPALIREFENAWDIRVHQTSFSSPEQRTRWLLETGGQGYDLIILSGPEIRPYARQGWLSPLIRHRLTSLGHIRSYWRRRFADAEKYAVPLAWGTLGIAWRADRVSEPLISWQQVYRPSESLSGHLGMIATPRHLIGMGLKSLGYSANSESLNQLQEVRTLIRQLDEHVRTWGYQRPASDSELLSGRLHAAVIRNGDALRLQQQNNQLIYTIPMEGGSIWVDYFAVSANSRSPELAYRFIDFFSTPENAARQAIYSMFATPNTGAENLLPESFLTHPGIYPRDSGFAHSESYEHRSPEVLRYNNETLVKIRQ